ncbi:MAG: conjugal transfer protein TraW [Alphaproteobacteria bacterium]|nr:conjugal transfer protein TraW [Alphaproteobacteria bacterium]
MKKAGIAIVLYVFILSNSVSAKDFGNRGANYPVAEESILLMFQKKLGALDLKKEEERMRKVAEERVKNPAPVSGIVPAKETREFWHDPTYILTEDAVLPCGRVLYKAGTRVNHLDYMDLDRRLFFVDGREKKQVEWLKSRLLTDSSSGENKIEDRIILVGGSPMELKDKLGFEVYFDQAGELTTRFGIKGSPALAEQDGKSLKIVEVAVDPEK